MIAGYSYDGLYLEPKRAHINKGHLPLRYTVGLIHNHRHYSWWEITFRNCLSPLRYIQSFWCTKQQTRL